MKGLYKKALAGEIANFTGVSDPYEAPLNPEVILDTDRETPQESAAKLLAWLEEHGYIPALVEEGAQPYSAQEQEAVQKRLKSLGYVE